MNQTTPKKIVGHDLDKSSRRVHRERSRKVAGEKL